MQHPNQRSKQTAEANWTHLQMQPCRQAVGKVQAEEEENEEKWRAARGEDAVHKQSYMRGSDMLAAHTRTPTHIHMSWRTYKSSLSWRRTNESKWRTWRLGENAAPAYLSICSRTGDYHCGGYGTMPTTTETRRKISAIPVTRIGTYAGLGCQVKPWRR